MLLHPSGEEVGGDVEETDLLLFGNEKNWGDVWKKKVGRMRSLGIPSPARP